MIQPSTTSSDVAGKEPAFQDGDGQLGPHPPLYRALPEESMSDSTHPSGTLPTPSAGPTSTGDHGHGSSHVVSQVGSVLSKSKDQGPPGSSNVIEKKRESLHLTSAHLHRNSLQYEKIYNDIGRESTLQPPQAAARSSGKSEGKSAHQTGELVRYIKEPETRPISQEQLVAEIKGIYAGLVMIEQKCIEVDTKQAEILEKATRPGQAKLDSEQYKALIALHKTLLNEHHDFFLASQHPTANPALQRLAAKYAMPARMWRHAIHSFLELLRHRLPASRDYMLTFIYIAYSMMALLYETVPSFKDTWIECLGDLARYRMAIEESDPRDRQVWTEVASFWYTKAADRSPSTGRLYHHLAILARPHLQQQLFYYLKSLMVDSPFVSTRESIMTLLQPVLDKSFAALRALEPDHLFIRFHALLFLKRDLVKAGADLNLFLKIFEKDSIGKGTEEWRETGAYQAASNIASLFLYGFDDSPLRLLTTGFNAQKNSHSRETLPAAGTTDQCLFLARKMTFISFGICLRLTGNHDVQPHIHIVMVFIGYLQQFPQAFKLIENDVPWDALSSALNTLLRNGTNIQRIQLMQKPKFPQTLESSRPLTEDFLLRDLLFAKNYFPGQWFEKALADDDDARFLELPSMKQDRSDRISWLGYQIQLHTDRLSFDSVDAKFYARGTGPQHQTNVAAAEVGPEDTGERLPNFNSENRTWTMSKPASKSRGTSIPFDRTIVLSEDVLLSWASLPAFLFKNRHLKIVIPFLLIQRFHQQNTQLARRQVVDSAIKDGLVFLFDQDGQDRTDEWKKSSNSMDQIMIDADDDTTSYVLDVARNVAGKDKFPAHASDNHTFTILTEDARLASKAEKVNIRTLSAAGIEHWSANGFPSTPKKFSQSTNFQVSPYVSPG